MIISDKITALRKKNGWSQEELAERMNVSRQAVSKWESAQAIPDLDRILQLGALFGVTTDYLLKDEMESEEFTDEIPSTVKRIGMEQANSYLAVRRRASLMIALATFLCILSPIPLILLGAASEIEGSGITENAAGIIGLSSLFALVLCAIPLFLFCGFQNEPYAFLDKAEPFELEYGVKGLIAEKKKQSRSLYVRTNIVATCICIFSPVPLIISGFLENEFLTVIMLAVTMILAGLGAAAFIIVGIRNASLQKLLQEGDYTRSEKRRNAIKEVVGFAYWGITTAVYLVLSFLQKGWEYSWLIFAIAGILFPIVMSLCNVIADKHREQ